MRPVHEQHKRPRGLPDQCSRQARRDLERDENARVGDALLAALKGMEALQATEQAEVAATARRAMEQLWWALFAVRHELEPPEDLAGAAP